MTNFPSFRKKHNYTLAVAIFFLALVLSFLSPGGLFGLRPALVTALYPLQYASASLWKGFLNIPATVINLKNLAAENKELKEAADKEAIQIALLAEVRDENGRLRDALAFRSANRFNLNLRPAQVVARSGSVLEISLGSNSGVREDDIVVVKAGLVGRVIEVAPLSSKVQLINDGLSSFAGTDQRSRAYGVVEGANVNSLLMKYVDANSDVQVGDQIVTSTASSLAKPGIPIGTVTSAVKKDADLFYEIRIKPAVDFSRLEEVFVVI